MERTSNGSGVQRSVTKMERECILAEAQPSESTKWAKHKGAGPYWRRCALQRNMSVIEQERERKGAGAKAGA